MALVDLHFADDSSKLSYNCAVCRKNPQNAKMRRCDEPGFENLKKPRKVDKWGRGYTFCAGKATWFPEIVKLFQDCQVGMETGVLPRQGALEDQDALLHEVFFEFVHHWKFRMYRMIWRDVTEAIDAVLKSFSSKRG